MITTARRDADVVVASAQQVCKNLAELALGHVHDGEALTMPDESLGSVTLRPHQLDAVQRILTSFARHSGALLADSVGLGKTFTAIAIAREFKTVDVLAPAGLLPMWREALDAAGVSSAAVHSLHTFSRRAHEIPKGSEARSRLVIIDEAHHLRTRNTIRYRNVASFCMNARVLLMTATPLHNTSHELRNLLALFLGARDDSLDSQLLSSCVIRRNTKDVALNLPRVVEHTAPPITANLPVLESILMLSPPLPVADGAHASALVRLGLLRAWCSSDAALTSTIRRRQLRGEALLHSLTHGRYPTQRELQSWVVGNDSVQLGFPELLVSSANRECAPFLEVLTTHLDSLHALLTLHTRTSNADATRASYLRTLLHSEPRAQPGAAPEVGPPDYAHAPIIAFSQFASTVRALHRALSDIAGVASLTSAGGRIASGAISREQTIHRFSPRSNGRPPPPPHEQIRLLLTTDLLAEGVNLQDAGTVVHLDLPWTDALRQQRIGRIARMGSQHATVHSHTVEPPMGSAHALRLVETLERKAGLHRQWIGSNAREEDAVSHTSVADAGTALRALLHKWQALAVPVHAIARVSRLQILCASVPADHTGFLALLEAKGETVLLSSRAAGETLPSTDVRDTLNVAQRIDNWLSRSDASFKPLANRGFGLECSRALSQIDAWMLTKSANDLAGPSAREMSSMHHRALRELARRVETLPAIARSAHRCRIADAERHLRSAGGAGFEASISRWLEQRDQPVGEWLDGVPRTVDWGGANHVARPAGSVSRQPVASPCFRVCTLLLLRSQSDSEAAHD